MRKILITTDSFLPRWDGIARFLDEIIPRLKKYYKITVVAPNYGRVKYKGIKIVKFPLSRIAIAGYKPAVPVKEKIKNLIDDSDLVFNQSFGPIGVSAVMYASEIKKPTISYAHSVEWDLFTEAIYIPGIIKKKVKMTTRKLARIMYNKCSLIITSSDDVSKILKRNGIITRIETVKIGLSKEFVPGNTKKRFNLSDKIIIGYCGRLSREKNLGLLKDAFEKINAKNLYLMLVGDGMYMERLKGKNVKIIRNTKNIVEYLQAMDIFVMPSLTETSSLATLEAMRCGLPIVCTRVGYMKDYIKNGYSGYFIPKHDSRYLTKILIKLIGNKGLRSRLGRNARKSVAKLKWDDTAKGLAREFKRFI